MFVKVKTVFQKKHDRNTGNQIENFLVWVYFRRDGGSYKNQMCCLDDYTLTYRLTRVVVGTKRQLTAPCLGTPGHVRVQKRTRVRRRQRRGHHLEGREHLDVFARRPPVRLDVVRLRDVADALEDALETGGASVRTAVLADVAREVVRQASQRERRRIAGREARRVAVQSAVRGARADGERRAEVERAGRHCWKWL